MWAGIIKPKYVGRHYETLKKSLADSHKTAAEFAETMFLRSRVLS